MTRSINKPINITAVRFTEKFEAIPRRIELDGISYELGSDYRKVNLTTDNGTELLLEVSSDTHRFRLREHLFSWRLVSVSSKNA